MRHGYEDVRGLTRFEALVIEVGERVHCELGCLKPSLRFYGPGSANFVASCSVVAVFDVGE